MSGSAAIAATLRRDALLFQDNLTAAVAAVSKATIALRQAEDDILAIIAAADNYSLAADDLQRMATTVRTNADAALLAALQEAGAPSIQNGEHVLFTRQNAPTVQLIGPVPDEYLAQPHPPGPDRIKIRKALQDGLPANWAKLVDGSISLVRRAITP